jgi:hypothetical protein
VPCTVPSGAESGAHDAHGLAATRRLAAASGTPARFTLHVPPLHALSPAAGTRWPLPCSLSLKPGYRVMFTMAITRQSGIEPSSVTICPQSHIRESDPAPRALQALSHPVRYVAWCAGRGSNPHVTGTHAPEACASAYSATSALSGHRDLNPGHNLGKVACCHYTMTAGELPRPAHSGTPQDAGSQPGEDDRPLSLP